jgi:TRAP-type C4-dicarboxylate transport system permease large subunit
MNLDLRKKENLHVVFWLIKDFAWLAGFKWLGMGMAVPTVLLSYWLTFKSRSNRTDFFHNLAVSFWNTKRHLVIPVFVAGLTVIGYFYLTEYLSKRKNPA